MLNIDFNKGDGLVPVIIQDNTTLQVLMLGYMNEEAFRKTEDEGLVTFYSRSRQTLWTKGETSGNWLRVVTMEPDCDNDAILIKAEPAGPVCHTGIWSCFGEQPAKGFLYRLEEVINSRLEEGSAGSYTSRLFNEGTGKIAQKVGEEAVELVIEAMGDNNGLFKNEAADLMYHLLVLLRAKSVNLSEIEEVLLSRHKPG
jgi:phosphoribosyl-ATP pyrophosphohydrolase/phosphoribosyl-AMP cyclohydrolase